MITCYSKMFFVTRSTRNGKVCDLQTSVYTAEIQSKNGLVINEEIITVRRFHTSSRPPGIMKNEVAYCVVESD